MNMGRLHCPKQGWWSWLLWLVLLVALPCQSLGAFSNASGGNLRTTSYTPNALNQYSQITTPGVKDILGVALAANSLTVDGSTAARKGEYFQQPVNVANTGSALWRSVTVTSGGSSSNCAFAFPKYQTTPTYDLDGNLTFDGVWNYQWDAENRLGSMNMTNITGVPNAERKRLDFLYDDAGRRVMKAVSVWNGSAFANSATNWFVYDGWNLAGELSVTAEGFVELVRSYTWGLDLSGSLDGAGGIGGLVLVTDYATGTSYFPAYDGNGNIMALVHTTTGSVAAQYEYSPFGELIRSTGIMAKTNPFRWSTKYWDEETGLVYYGYRYYSPAMGRWISRDRIEEEGGNNLYHACNNNSILYIDPSGLSIQDVSYPGGHHVGTAQLARSLAAGEGTKLLGSYTIEVNSNHKWNKEHVQYNKAVGEEFEVWLKAKGVSREQVAKSADLAREFLNHLETGTKNSNIRNYLSNVSFNSQKSARAAVILAGAAGSALGAYNAAVATRGLVQNLQDYQRAAATGDDAWITLEAVATAVTIQSMTGDYFVTVSALGLLLQ